LLVVAVGLALLDTTAPGAAAHRSSSAKRTLRLKQGPWNDLHVDPWKIDVVITTLKFHGSTIKITGV
jgi:hypothetical protein